jgi:photosystem II stability/assembly factor-like uncharacterized protein
MKTILVGTADGILRLERVDGAWENTERILPGNEISAITIKPDNRDTIYAATRGNGLYASEDGGSRWERRGEQSLAPKVRCLTIDPSNPAVLYAGAEPASLFASDDEGTTWKEIPGVRALAQERAWTYPVPNIEPHVRSVVVDPTNSQHIFLAAQVGGVIQSKDGGKSWSDVRDSIDMDVHSIAIDPQRTTTVYAATGGDEAYPNPSHPPKGMPLYRSNDGGLTWQSITEQLDRTYAIPIKVDPENSQVLYMGVGRDVPPYWPKRASMGDAALMRSTDGGRSWQRMTNGLPDPLISMVECIEMDPQDPGSLVIATEGEGARFVNLTEGELYLSRDRGENWAKISATLPIIYSLAVQ